MKQKLITSIFIAVLSIVLIPAHSAFAANPASFSLSPSTSSVVKGSSFTVVVYENGDNVNAVTTKLTFNSAQLQLNSTSCGGSFSSSIAETNGQTCFTAGGSTVNGSVLALSASFTALANSGSASVSIATGSKIVSSDTNTNIWNGAASATSVTLTAPATAPTQPAAGGSTNTGSANTTSSATSNEASNTSTPATGNSTSQTSTTSNSGASSNTTASSTAEAGEVKSATDTKNATKTLATAQTNEVAKKVVSTTILPLIIALAVFLALTYPVIFSSIKKAKITQIIRQRIANITSK